MRWKQVARRYPDMEKFETCILFIVIALLATITVVTLHSAASTDLASISNPASVPPWFQTGEYRPARWDGGPLEAKKGVLSGYFSSNDPRLLEAEKHWYSPKTLQFLKTAHINWAWLTWSNGFSPQTEERQQNLVRHYIALCHQNNIRVSAYISIGNIFWEDMLQHIPSSIAWVRREPDGSPWFYSHPYRYMANIESAGWLKLQEGRVVAAVRAGADAIWIDNTFNYYGERPVANFIDAIYAVAVKINPHIVIMSNYNHRIYTWAQLQNGVTTEDGHEPGYYTDRSKPYLVTNAGLMRYQYAIGEGWRPVSVEDGTLHAGHRETRLREPQKWQLEIAEAAMYHEGYEVFVEGAFARDLYFGERAALTDLRAIGTYNAFLQRNEQYYTHPESLAKVAVLCDTTDAAVPYLDQLSEYNLNYDVIFNYQSPQREGLERYKVILLPNTNPLSEEWCTALSRWVKQAGGTLIAVQDASLFHPGPASPDQDFGLSALLGLSKRHLPQSTKITSQGKGEAIYLPRMPAAGEMVSMIQGYLKQSELVQVDVPTGTLSNVAYQPELRRVVLHILNYRQKLETGICIQVRAPIKKVDILSPDHLEDGKAMIVMRGGVSEVTIPQLRTYDLVAMYLAPEEAAQYGFQ